jgi:hypothetical protein
MTIPVVITMLVAAAIAVAAGRHARRSRLALLLAAAAGVLVLDYLAGWALGYVGCGDRGGCTGGAAVFRAVGIAALLGTAGLLVAAGMRWAWRQVRRRLPRRRAAARGRRRGLLGRDPRVRRDIFLTGFGLLVGAVSVAVIAGGDAGGIISLLFALTLLVVPLSERLPDGSGPRLGRVRHDGVLQPALILAAGRARRAMLALGSALFAATAGGILILPGGSVVLRVVGVLGLVVFGTFAVANAWGLTRPWAIVLLRDGLRWDVGTSHGLIAWDDIDGTGLYEINGSPFLGLVVSRPGAITRTRVQRWLARADRAVSGADQSIPLGMLSVDPERLDAAVSAYAANTRARLEIGTEASLGRVTDAARAWASSDAIGLRG